MTMLVNSFLAQAASSLPVTDSFNRANSAVTLNTASDGTHAWTAQHGTWGIDTNQGYCPVRGSNNYAIATVSPGASDGTLQMTLVNMLSVAQTSGFVFRFTDIDHYLYAVYHWNIDHFRVYEVRPAGSVTQIGDAVVVGADGTVIKLVLAGNSIKFYFGATLKIDITSTYQQTEKIHGLYTEATGARFEDFSMIA